MYAKKRGFLQRLCDADCLNYVCININNMKNSSINFGNNTNCPPGTEQPTEEIPENLPETDPTSSSHTKQKNSRNRRKNAKRMKKHQKVIELLLPGMIKDKPYFNP